eukprot:scaffold25842_cov198-Amphora_coffeaeformis.AAC.23
MGDHQVVIIRRSLHTGHDALHIPWTQVILPILGQCQSLRGYLYELFHGQDLTLRSRPSHPVRRRRLQMNDNLIDTTKL